MKSERRHELQHNDLLEWTVKTWESVSPYKNTILGVALLAIVAGVVVWVWLSRSQAAAAEAWDGMNPPLVVPNFGNQQQWGMLDNVANKYPDTSAGEWANVSLADSLLFYGQRMLMEQPDTARPWLKNSVEKYDKVLATATDAMARQRALFGKGRALESLGQLEEAKAAYQQLNTDYPQGTYKAIVDQRLAELAKPETAELYKALADFKPKPKEENFKPKSEEEKGPLGKLDEFKLRDNPPAEPAASGSSSVPKMPSFFPPSEKAKTAYPPPSKSADSSKAAPPATTAKPTTGAPAKTPAAEPAKAPPASDKKDKQRRCFDPSGIDIWVCSRYPGCASRSGANGLHPSGMITCYREHVTNIPRYPTLSDEPVEFVVEESEAGQRLDALLTVHFHNYSRGHLRRVISAGGVTIDGQGGKPAYRVRAGQRVRIILPEIPRQAPRPEAIPLEILYEDEDLVVVNKPPGMVVHPARGHWSGTLVSALQYHFGPSLSSSGGPLRPGIVHRLDRDTSGAILVARHDQAHGQLAIQFESRSIEKEYFALVAGTPQLDSDIIDRAIAVHPLHREKMTTVRDDNDGRTAQTFYRVVERFRGFAAVRAMPKTGRTHQIRVHLAHAGIPVLCDRAYGHRAELTRGELSGAADDPTVLLNRQALHAERLRFRHPRDGRPMEIAAPLPADIAATLDALRKYR